MTGASIDKDSLRYSSALAKFSAERRIIFGGGLGRKKRAHIPSRWGKYRAISQSYKSTLSRGRSEAQTKKGMQGAMKREGENEKRELSYS